MKNYLIILAAGSGSRLGEKRPKQFLLLAGRPVLMHTIDAFFRAGTPLEIVVVLHQDHIDYWHSLCAQYDFKIPHRIAQGGKERFHSVKNALTLLPKQGLVGIHDGVRPFVTERIIRETFAVAKTLGNAVPAVTATNTIRFSEDRKRNRALNRDHVYVVQNPQVFHLAEIKKAYCQEYQPLFTDDATVAESYGIEINMVEGDERNIKITYACDLDIAEGIFHYNQMNLVPNMLCLTQLTTEVSQVNFLNGK